jgi:hypothetical protein
MWSRSAVPRAHPLTVPLLPSHFSSLRVEIAVFPVFYKQLFKEASSKREQAGELGTKCSLQSAGLRT